MNFSNNIVVRNTPMPNGQNMYGQAPVNYPQQRQPQSRVVYSQKTTKNKSFLDMHHYLKSIGIKNNEFMLALLDPDLDGINPHDPLLNAWYKQKILRECICNFWYFIREVVRLPSSGAAPMMYKLDRGNMAYNFVSGLNLNTFLEEPRQCGKTTGVIIRYLYLYNFGTTNSKMAFLHKGMEGAKDNLTTFKAIRDLLPPYLLLSEKVLPGGKVDKGRNNTTDIANPFNNNSIKTFASATNKARAASLLRGKTLVLLWYDEYGFLPYNDVIYMNGAPAFKTASAIAKQNGAPYGITITTTPGFMSTPEGKEAYAMKESATVFSESWYDMTYAQIMEIINSNTSSNYVYVKYTYQQLGCSDEWFNEVCLLLKNSWPDIRREILLEWATGVDNSPFAPDDLDAISGMIRQPISVVYLLNKYRFESYLQVDTRTYPPIIGVDVAGGYKKDSSTITIIDSLTTKVLGCMNCNYISTLDLARCIEFIVKNWMPNAVVNVERNGGYGATVISKLLKMGLRKNLYYEIKDKVVEERQDGIHAYKQKVRVKEYGLNSSKDVRKNLIDILIERVENHKDKIISPIIYNELLGMEIKRNGKVEHSAATHDDQVFSMLMALYVWYEGVDLGERYGIRKSTIKTDEDIDESLDYYSDESGVEIVSHFVTDEASVNQEINADLNAAINAAGPTIKEYIDRVLEQERQKFNEFALTPLGSKAYREAYNLPPNARIEDYVGEQNAHSDIPYSVFDNFYKENTSISNPYDDGSGIYDQIGAVPADVAMTMNDGDYNYYEHFNF